MDLIAKDDTNIEDLVIENSFKILTNQRWKNV